MKNKWLKRISIVAGILFLIILLANFGVNFWLKNKLPDYLKKNTDYIITYKNLNVDLGTGNIFVSGISVNTKNPDNTAIVRLQGTVDVLKISRFGIYDAIFNKKISSNNLLLGNPDLNIILAKPKDKTSKKKQNLPEFENISINNGNIRIFKADNQKFLSVNNLNLSVENIWITENSRENALSVVFDKYLIKGENLFFRLSNQQEFKIASFSLNPKSGNLQKIFAFSEQKSGMNFTGERITFKMNEFGFKENKLNLDVENILIDRLNGTIKAAANSPKKKSDFSGIRFPVKIKIISLKNSNLVYDKGNQPLAFNDLNANLNAMEISPKPDNSGLAFNLGNYSAMTRDFKYKTQFYNLAVGLLEVSKSEVQVSNFSMIPTVSRSEFIKMIPVEKDLYTLKAAQISMTGKWDFFSNNKFLEATNVTIQSANANIFRSKIPKDDPKIKPLYSELLRTIKFPMFVHQLNVKNSLLEYEEDTPKSDGPGKLTFSDFNLNAQNLNSAKMKGKPTEVPITINCKFFKVSPMHVNWKFNTANLSDVFTISGSISDLPAPRINQFIEPYLKIRATGTIKELKFNFKGNKKELNGTMDMNHEDLKVSLLKKDGEKNKILSAIVNIFVKSNTDNSFENAVVDNVQRDPMRSFFNLFWKGIEEGLKKVLIGKNVEQTEKNLKEITGKDKISSKK